MILLDIAGSTRNRCFQFVQRGNNLLVVCLFYVRNNTHEFYF